MSYLVFLSPFWLGSLSNPEKYEASNATILADATIRGNRPPGTMGTVWNTKISVPKW